MIKWFRRELRNSFWFLLGSSVGLAVGVAFPILWGGFTQWLSGDPSAGAVAIVGIYTGPICCAIGACVGMSMDTRRSDKD